MGEKVCKPGAVKPSETELLDNVSNELHDLPQEDCDKIAKALKEEEQKEKEQAKAEKLEHKRKQGFIIIDKNHPIAKQNKEKIEKSKEAKERAIDEHMKLGRKYRKNTIASDGIKTINGWSENTPEGFSRANPKEIHDYSQNSLGYEIERSGGLDYGGNKDEGFPGKRRASDAEKQLIFQKSNEPIGVSREMCQDCTNFFEKEAQYRECSLAVSEPGGTNVFDKNGSRFFIPE